MKFSKLDDYNDYDISYQYKNDDYNEPLPSPSTSSVSSSSSSTTSSFALSSSSLSPLSAPLSQRINSKLDETIIDYTSNEYDKSYKFSILLPIGLLAFRVGLSALFWDRSVHSYMDLFDSNSKSQIHQV
jgi:hypothetical protein